jgi:hypothetical protein
MARAYLRLDPGYFDRKAIEQKYPPGAVAALIGALCHAEHQPQRGRFRDTRVLKALLGPYAKWIPFLIERRDLVVKKGVLYVDGWDEWQEGDWKVGERVKRIRNRAKATEAGGDVTPDVTPDVTVDVTVGNESPDSVGTVYNLSDGGRQSVIDGAGGGDSPQPPASGGRRSRANGTSPRQLDAAAQAEAERQAKAKAWRRNQRQLAYVRGAITDAQQRAMDEADTPLDEIPGYAEHMARLQAEQDAGSPLDADVKAWIS